MAKLAKLSSQNQITLPKEALKRYPNAEYFEVCDVEGGILLSPAKIITEETRAKALAAQREAWRRSKELGLTEKDVDDAVRWAREQRKK